MLRTCGLVIAVALLMGACGGGEAMPAPSNLQYALGTGEVGSPYGPYPPSVSGTVTGYSVSPALPAGLTLDPTSGVISGTPLAASSATTYTVTARNGAGATTAVLTFAVLVPPPLVPPPTGLTYTSPVTGTVGAALTPVVPTLSGMQTPLRSFRRFRPAWSSIRRPAPCPALPPTRGLHSPTRSSPAMRVVTLSPSFY